MARFALDEDFRTRSSRLSGSVWKRRTGSWMLSRGPGSRFPGMANRGWFRVSLEDGTEPELRDWIACPFGLFHGTADGPIPHGSTHHYSLVYLPARRIVATFRTARDCKILASELARLWVRWAKRARRPGRVSRRTRN